MTKIDTTPKANWQAVDVASLTPEIAKLYAIVSQTAKANAIAYKAMKVAEENCTKAILAGQTAPEGKLFKVAFRYGLAIALVDAETDKPARKGTLSLADYLKAQAA